jgi:hypothetical protein
MRKFSKQRFDDTSNMAVLQLMNADGTVTPCIQYGQWVSSRSISGRTIDQDKELFASLTTDKSYLSKVRAQKKTPHEKVRESIAKLRSNLERLKAKRWIYFYHNWGLRFQSNCLSMVPGT